MSSRNVETLRTAHQAFNRRDFATIKNLLAADITYKDHGRGLTFQGKEGMLEFLQGWVSAFSDCAVTNPVYLDAGDTIVAEFSGTGTNDGSLGPLQATDKPMSFPVCEIFQFNSEGKIASGRIYYDQLSIMSQLGHTQGAPRTMSA